MPRRRKPTPAEVRAIRRMLERNEESVWFQRWAAAIPFAAANYRRAVLERAEANIDKYIAGLKRLKIKALG